jgi:hypothetical protein
MLDIFRPLPPEARRESRAAYQKFLADRDGALDLEKRQLQRREAGMLRYEKPLSRIREIDRGLFKAQYVSFDTKLATSPELMLLLTLVKCNAAEAYGVNQGFDRKLREATKSADTLELVLLIEETYHTRILLSTAMSYGVELTEPYRPPFALRALIGGIAFGPAFMARPLTMAAEVLGVCVFLNLLEKSHEVLRHDPELRDAVEERLCEILVDEIGHVSFNRACLGAAGLAQARVALPVVARGLSGVVPELRLLGVASLASEGEVTALASGKRLPEHVVKSAFLS